MGTVEATGQDSCPSQPTVTIRPCNRCGPQDPGELGVLEADGANLYKIIYFDGVDYAQTYYISNICRNKSGLLTGVHDFI